MLDGWSNTSANPITAVSIHTAKDIRILDSVDCGLEKENCKRLF